MNDRKALAELERIRPLMRAFLALHRAAQTEEARSAAAGLLEEAFVAASWRMARDMVENDWSPSAPVAAPVASHPVRAAVRPKLRLVGGGKKVHADARDHDPDFTPLRPEVVVV